MTQERTTSLRILQTNKKKTLSPVIYIIIGFISGVLFTSLIFFVFVMGSNPADTAMPQQEQTIEENPTVMPNAKATTHNTDEVATIQHETTEPVEENNIAQPGSNDLNKFFQRTPAAPAPSGQQVSPFANEPNAKPQQKVVPTKLPQGKNETVPMTNKTVKPAAPQPAKAAPTKTPEAEVEAPEATVQIKVTQKPFAVNDLK
ncbi:hypothetical protein F909_01810 [Acinetobacter sp. ANC 3929]|uniref:hypothetical protein n=1 Tax=unclassified Acinetobacter TaxID=196816 RepID=UPI0002CEF0D9|nr:MULTISPECIES: hypothetical protein [unclassified Acinetobacter]ENW80524.1 hypothetical protein F909_01810 [Acinetobacter sp. ANC 3929]MCH7352824.1 hypothetical protein [Acinetobacter sp. NIPH 2023]MCH7354005.1 hypothetical protein [Acinetobacter sp. NIPH 1958]MCH7360481.1 hypothetical protein [Acinetobacter sp. NIPH 2024]